jgi:hypothetical protein
VPFRRGRPAPLPDHRVATLRRLAARPERPRDVVGGAVRAARRAADLDDERLHARAVVGDPDHEALRLARKREVGRLRAFERDLPGEHLRLGGRERRQQPLAVVRVQQPSQVRHVVVASVRGRSGATTPGGGGGAPVLRPGRRWTGVINPAEPALASYGQRDTFAARMGQIGPLVAARLLGRRLTVVPPDERAWPYHCHHANEEVLVTGGGDLR